jgi:hypothetical protein
MSTSITRLSDHVRTYGGNSCLDQAQAQAEHGLCTEPYFPVFGDHLQDDSLVMVRTYFSLCVSIFTSAKRSVTTNMPPLRRFYELRLSSH